MENIDTFGTKLLNRLESTEHRAEEHELLDNATIEVYPDSKIEGREPQNQCFFYPNIPDQNSLRSSSRTWPSSLPTVCPGRSKSQSFTSVN